MSEVKLHINVRELLYSNPHNEFQHSSRCKERKQYFCSYRGGWFNSTKMILQPMNSNFCYHPLINFSHIEMFKKIWDLELIVFGDDVKLRYKVEEMLDFLSQISDRCKVTEDEFTYVSKEELYKHFYNTNKPKQNRLILNILHSLKLIDFKEKKNKFNSNNTDLFVKVLPNVLDENELIYHTNPKILKRIESKINSNRNKLKEGDILRDIYFNLTKVNYSNELISNNRDFIFGLFEKSKLDKGIDVNDYGDDLTNQFNQWKERWIKDVRENSRFKKFNYRISNQLLEGEEIFYKKNPPTKSLNGGRITTHISTLPKVIREFIEVDGVKTTELDFKQSQPTLLRYILKNDLFEGYGIKTSHIKIKDGDLYELLRVGDERVSRKQLKERFFKILYSTNTKNIQTKKFLRLIGGDELVNVWVRIQSIVGMKDMFGNPIKSTKYKSKNLCIFLQSLESLLLEEIMKELIDEDIWNLGIYDSVICKVDDKEEVERIMMVMLEEFDMKVG